MPFSAVLYCCCNTPVRYLQVSNQHQTTTWTPCASYISFNIDGMGIKLCWCSLKLTLNEFIRFDFLKYARLLYLKKYDCLPIVMPFLYESSVKNKWFVLGLKYLKSLIIYPKTWQLEKYLQYSLGLLFNYQSIEQRLCKWRVIKKNTNWFEHTETFQC